MLFYDRIEFHQLYTTSGVVLVLLGRVHVGRFATSQLDCMTGSFLFGHFEYLRILS